MLRCKPARLWAMVVFFCMHTLFYATPMAAQDKEEEKGEELAEAKVTAARPRFSITSPMPMQTLSGDLLKSLNSLSVADAIRYFSGVQLKDYGGVGGLKTVNVRSLGSAHTAVFYDGIPIGNAQNGQVDLGKFSLDNVEEVQLYNGNRTVIFQPAKSFFSSNTLFLKSKTPHFAEGKTSNAIVGFKTGSFGLLNPSIMWQQKLSQSSTLSANAEYLNAHGRYKFRYTNGTYDSTYTRTNSDIEALRAELSFKSALGSDGELSLKAYLYTSERGLPGAAVANIKPDTYKQRLWDRSLFLHGSVQKAFGEKYSLLFNVKYGKDYSRYKDPDMRIVDDTLSGLFHVLDNRYHQDELYVSLANQYTFTKWWSVALATDFFLNTLDANLYRFPYPTRYSYYGALASNMEWDRLLIQASFLAVYVDEQVKYHQRGDDQSVFCPVVSVSYQPFKGDDKLRVRAFYKESFRMPTFNDLYYTFIGNTSLRPEFTTQYDVGFTWQYNSSKLVQNVSIQADAYYNQAKDMIVAVPANNQFRWTMMNLGQVEVKGVEANASFGIAPFKHTYINLGLNYTYQRSVEVTDKSSEYYGDQIPYIPVHSGTVTASAEWKRWRLNYSFIYTGERYNQAANILRNYVQPWYTHDIALSWTFMWKKKELKLTAEVNNLFNQDFDVVANFPMPLRSYRFGLMVNI